MKKIFILLTLLVLSLSFYGCGGGGGSADLPGGQNPGIPSVVQLTPAHYISQTNGCITLDVKVLDGNGAPVKAVPVTFTNLSYPLGDLRHACNPNSGIVNSPINTDNTGIARAYVLSATPGFATILAQVDTGAGQVRDRKTVYFTTNDVLRVSMDMDVESVPGNGIDNEKSDFTLFENSEDDTVEILATVNNAGGKPVGGGWGVIWSRSHTEATWVWTETSTNVSGQAKAVVKVEPSSIRNTETHVNIMAYAANGAANMVTLFLRPVVPDPSTSYLTANPSVVDVNGNSTISAVVMLNTGARAPDGTAVNFKVECNKPGSNEKTDFPGIVTPFAQTTGGVAQAVFTAPPVPAVCTVSGKVAGVSIGSVKITVKAALTIMPSTQTVTGGATATFTIFGGVAPYTVLSSHPSVASPSLSGTTITVTTSVVSADVDATITVRDALGATATAILKILAAGGGGGGGGATLTISPSSATVTAGGTVTFVITGGTASYNVTSSHSSIAYDTAPGDGSWTVSASGGTFTVTTSAALSSSVTVTLTAIDSVSNIASASLTVNPANGGGSTLNLNPSSIALTGLSEPNSADDIVFSITGGTSPYTMYSNNVAVIPSQGVVGPTFTVDPATVGAKTDVVITVVDSVGAFKTATVTVNPVSPALSINPSAIHMTAGSSTIFYILGGTGGSLSIVSGAANVTLTGCGGTGQAVLSCAPGTTSFTVNAVSTSTTPTTITVIDITGGTNAQSSVTVN